MIERPPGIVKESPLGIVRLVKLDRPRVNAHQRPGHYKVVQLTQGLLEILNRLRELLLAFSLVQMQRRDELERIAQLLRLDAKPVPFFLPHMQEVSGVPELCPQTIDPAADVEFDRPVGDGLRAPLPK